MGLTLDAANPSPPHPPHTSPASATTRTSTVTSTRTALPTGTPAPSYCAQAVSCTLVTSGCANKSPTYWTLNPGQITSFKTGTFVSGWTPSNFTSAFSAWNGLGVGGTHDWSGSWQAGPGQTGSGGAGVQSDLVNTPADDKANWASANLINGSSCGPPSWGSLLFLQPGSRWNGYSCSAILTRINALFVTKGHVFDKDTSDFLAYVGGGGAALPGATCLLAPPCV